MLIKQRLNSNCTTCWNMLQSIATKLVFITSVILASHFKTWWIQRKLSNQLPVNENDFFFWQKVCTLFCLYALVSKFSEKGLCHEFLASLWTAKIYLLRRRLKSANLAIACKIAEYWCSTFQVVSACLQIINWKLMTVVFFSLCEFRWLDWIF